VIHSDHIALLRPGVSPGGAWADFGSGQGAFTLALAELLGPGSHIYSVDKDRGALAHQESLLTARYPTARVEYFAANFLRPLDLPPLDGAVMANSLHYQRNKEPIVKMLRAYLKPGGRFLLVEYNVDHGNPWVPYPISFVTWQMLARHCGFTETRLLGKRPSRFLKEIYSAESW